MHTQSNGQSRIVSYGIDSSTGNYVPILITNGAQNVNIYPPSVWKYAAPAGGIVNSTAPVEIAIAQGGSYRNRITSLQIIATGITVATELLIRDGAGGTVIWRFPISTAGIPLGISIPFPSGLAASFDTAIEINCSVAAGVGSAIYVNAQGMVGT